MLQEFCGVICKAIQITSFIFFVLLFSCREEKASILDGTFEIMGTSVFVKPKKALATVEEVFTRVDCEMSEWKSESPLSQINRSAGKTSIQCSDSLVAAITKSLFVAEITKGAFDPTWACMWDIWDFNTSIVPGKQEINSRLPFVDWEKVEVRGNFVFLQKEGMLLGLGGIAKGVALDDARETLLLQGVNDFMLQCGGQILAQGKERVIGVRNPDGLPHEIIGKVSIKNQSISTSGNYEKYFILDDIRYHHILDPRTGYPAIGMKSVTVVTENAALGDALSTALFVMGTGKGMLFVERTVGVEVLFIDSESVIHKSSGFILN